MSVDPDLFRLVMGRFPSGVTVVTARDANGADCGMTVSSFASVSLEPPLVLVCIDKTASMHPLLQQVRDIGISMLAEDQEQLSRLFADGDAQPFAALDAGRGASGVALLPDAAAHLECIIHARHDAGDHTLVVARVEHARAFETRPLLYYRSGYSRLPG